MSEWVGQNPMSVLYVCAGGDAEADLSLHSPDEETAETGRR